MGFMMGNTGVTEVTEVSWFVAHTHARAEWLARKNLIAQGFEVFYPHFLGTVKHARRAIGVIKPYFPRYVFVGVEPGQAFRSINSTIGVSTIVYSCDGPLKVPTQVMDDLRRRATAAGRIELPSEPEGHGLAVGQRATVMDGPLAGFMAQISKVDDSPNVRVWVSILGRSVETSLPAMWLKD